MQPQYSQGAVTSHHASYGSTEISGNGGSITSSLRQWRKKDYVEKQQSTDTSTTSTAENTSHVARVAPHTYYPPRPVNDVCHYQHQYTDYGGPYKPPTIAPVKYSEIVENQQAQSIENITPIIQKHKEKEYVDFPPPQPHLKQYQDLPLKPPYPDSVKQPYVDQYMVKESQMPPYMQKPPQMHQYMQKEPYQQFLSKYNMQNQYPQPYPSEPNNFLAHLNKINPRMAQSIINDTHLRDAQIPMYHNLDQNRSYPQPQRMYHGPPMNTSPTHSHRSIPPQQYNYPQPYNCIKQGNDPYNRIQYQHNVPKYLPDYKMNNSVDPNIPNISQGLFNERLHMNYGPMSPNYPPCNQLEYAQHYQHRRSQIPPEYLSHPGYKQYMDSIHMLPDDNCTNQRGRKPSLKQYLETWVDEDLAGNLPDIIISNNMNDENIETIKSAVCVKGSDKQEAPLYVLDTTEIPDENLPHFLHLQQFEKLPDNIRGYYHSTNSLPGSNRRIIVENNSESCVNSQVIRDNSASRGEVPLDRIGNEGCVVGNQNKIVPNNSGMILETPVQNLENKVVQIHIVEEPDPTSTTTNVIDTCSTSDTVIIKSNLLEQNLISNSDENCLLKQQDQLLNKLDSHISTEINNDSVKNMPVIDDGFNADETSDCLGVDSLTQSEDSSSNQSSADEHSEDAVFENQQVCEDLTAGISSIYNDMESIHSNSNNTVLHNNTKDVVDSKDCENNLNESKIPRCIPIQSNSEINDYLHSPENLDFTENSNILVESALNFEALAFPNSDLSDTVIAQTDAVSVSNNIDTDLLNEEFTKTDVNESDNTVQNVKSIKQEVLDIVQVDSILNVIEGQLEEDTLTESIFDDNTQSTIDTNELSEQDSHASEKINTEDLCENILLNSEENTKDELNENCAIVDESIDDGDDNSMPHLDKYIDQPLESNHSKLLEDNELLSKPEETNASTDATTCDKPELKLANNNNLYEETEEDFEKPPDLTNSKFGVEIEKETKPTVVNKTCEVEKDTESFLEGDPVILVAKDPEAEHFLEPSFESCVIPEKITFSKPSNDEASYKSFENVPKSDKALETDAALITKSKSHRKHKARSDRNSKTKRKEKYRRSYKESNHSKIENTSRKSDTHIEHTKDKSNDNRPNTKKSSTDRLRKSEKENCVKAKTSKGELKVIDDETSAKVAECKSNSKNEKNIEDKGPSCVADQKTESSRFKSKNCKIIAESLGVPNKDIPTEIKMPLGDHLNSDAHTILEEYSQSSDEPLTMIKVEQTYLDETYENANTNVVYQIADNNVVLQIADELLEINVTSHNGRKVIFVKTLTDAIIMSNYDEEGFNALDIQEDTNTKEELLYEKICEDVEILLHNNNYITETKNSNCSSDDEISRSLKEICGEPDVTVLAGDEVCISNEEIVSSSTTENYNNEHTHKVNLATKQSNTPQKVVTWEDKKPINTEIQEDPLQNSNNEDQPRKRPKTKAALKYLEAINEPLLKPSEVKIPRSRVDDNINKSKKTQLSTKKQKSKNKKHVKHKNSDVEKPKSKVHDTKNNQNTEDVIKTIEKSTKNKKRKTSPTKITSKLKESLPVKIEKEKIEKYALKTKIEKDQNKVVSPKIPLSVVDSAPKDDIVKLQNTKVTVSVLLADIVQPVPDEIIKKCEDIEDAIKVVEAVVEDTQISVQENSITSSTSSQEQELSSKSNNCKLAQQISEEWEEDADDIKIPQVSTKKRLSLEEYNNRKRSSSMEQKIQQQSDLTNNLLDNINYNCIKSKREVSPESPVLSVNFNNKTYSRNLSSSTRSNSSPNLAGNYDLLTNSIELQLPKINRIPKPVYSQEYLQNALKNDLFTVNAFTTTLIKENQQLMQRFLNQQRLSMEELKKVKQIIRYKRLIQQLTTLKINGLNSSNRQESCSIRENMIKANCHINVYDLDKGQSSARVTMEDPLKPFNCGPERRKRKRFRFLYSGIESGLDDSESLPSNVGEQETSGSNTKRPRLDTSVPLSETTEPNVGYSVYQANSQSQLTLVFKRSFTNDPKMQPFVKLERLFSIDQLAKNRFY